MKKLFFCFIFLSCCILFNSYSQNPGYKGRNFSVELENFINPSITFPNSNEKIGLTSFNSRHGISARYTLSTVVAAGLSFNFYSTKLDINSNYYSRYVENTDTFAKEKTHLGYGKVNGQNIGIYLRFSLDEVFLPLGDYIEVGFHKHFYKLTYDRDNFTYKPKEWSNNTNYLLPEKENYSYDNYGVSFSFGTERIVYDHFFIDYGIQINYMFSKNFFNYGFGEQPSYSRIDEESLKLMTSNRVQSHNIISLQIGIGYLPF